MKKCKKTSIRERISGVVPEWTKWGPYVSERSWGTVREDYSDHGDSWAFFPHDMARKKAYRWGEDGIAGICDRYQVLVFSFAFWNGLDPILKERMYGLNSMEGNHGEDVKEYYFYLDCHPNHTYMKYLYKYPQAEYPYQKLIDENQKLGLEEPEYELSDTGVFDDDRYFDLFIEYAKETPEEICIKLEICNRGPEESTLHVLPHLFFRNFWRFSNREDATPSIHIEEETDEWTCVVADDANCNPIQQLNFPYNLGKRYLYAEKGGEALFTDNETNHEALNTGKNLSPHVKDAFHREIIDGEKATNPDKKGTKSCIHYAVTVPANSSKVMRFCLSDEPLKSPFKKFDKVLESRKKETDTYYEKIHPKNASEDEKSIQRQAFAGMLWSKQIYLYDVKEWLKGDDEHPAPPGREHIRNEHWKHLVSKRILSMPDKWEYPWFAAWDLAFHCISYALVDMEFAKEQLWLLLFDQFQHPNGQIPAYEWEFSDLNPPVQAWAAWRIYLMEHEQTGKKDKSFLKKCFHKLILNFVWWVNRVDRLGNNVFEGGFLGLDNITVIDRSMEIPGGGSLEQSDGTGWMGMFCLLLMKIALELAEDDADYESMAVKFFEHYVYIAAALTKSPNREVQIWNEKDGFFYDVLSANNTHEQIFVRSLVGIIPLYAIESIDQDQLDKFPEFRMSFNWFMENRKDLTDTCITPIEKDGKKNYLLALIQLGQIKRVLTRVWDKDEFRSDYGLRSLSKYHEQNPYHLGENSVSYEPAESKVQLKGGNSNWRGPIWFPSAYLFIESLKRLHQIVGEEETFEANDGTPVTIKEMTDYFAHSMIDIFKRGENGKRPVYGNYTLFQENPHFKDYIFFHEYYHGDHGWGLGASHQTGWSGLVANLISEFI